MQIGFETNNEIESNYSGLWFSINDYSIAIRLRSHEKSEIASEKLKITN